MSIDPQQNEAAILKSPSYRLAQQDIDLLARPELRPVRMQLELLKPELLLESEDVRSTIVVYGSTLIVDREHAAARLATAQDAAARDPDDAALAREVKRSERLLAKANYYDAAREFSRIVSTTCQLGGLCDYVIITGGGPGIMEAANRGAFEVGAKSIGLNIRLPREQTPNPYITPNLCFQFHYFALRKMHFLLRAKALVAFPGGFGTLDEMFDALALRQTRRMQAIPIILFGRSYWQRVIDFQFLADEGVIAESDLSLFSFADTPDEAWNKSLSFHAEPPPASVQPTVAPPPTG
jgi:uncharacterized protein (TIGR00730 family)